MIGRTRFGRGLQAIDAGRRRRAVVGVPSDRYVGLAFGLVGALAVVIAIAAAPSGPFSVTTGMLLGVKGLVAALVVGFRSPMWAFVAGLALGVVEAGIASGTISGHGLGPAYREVVPILRSCCSCWRCAAARGCASPNDRRRRRPPARSADAAGEAKAGWRGIHAALLCLFALACAVPWIAPGWVHVDVLAAWLYLALAATGLVADRRARRAAVARPGRVHERSAR